MADRANSSGLRDVVEDLLLVALGAASATAERADAIANELAERGGLRREEARQLVSELTGRWRGDRERLSERAASSLQSLFGDLRLVTRDEHDSLELRVAQLEHRLRLVERDADLGTGPAVRRPAATEPPPPQH